MDKKLRALFGLKFNPFDTDVPAASLHATAATDLFCRRMERLAGEGGFALVSGDPGTGKSAVLRVLVDRLAPLRDVLVGALTRPQASMADFYREIGHLFGVPLAPHNRWAGANALRETWAAHIETALSRPVLVVDEAQEMRPAVLSELRLLASAELDSRSILTVVLAGDARLTERLRTPELLPLGSRIRARLHLEYASPGELQDCLAHVLKEAGNAKLMTPALVTALCEHAAGNRRALMNMANALLDVALERELKQLDEGLYLETFASDAGSKKRRRA
ncbi:MAG: AAA family ATPase [Gammaproteobacteria bacterium]|nr:AAA family ATPase [Gammaproteobacteria bacterium]